LHRAVLLDLGKTIIDFDLGRAFARLAEVCPYSRDELTGRLMGSGLVERFETGRIDGPEMFLRASEILRLELDYETFVSDWNCIFGEILIPEKILETLAARYRLLLISNTNQLHFDMLLREHKFFRHFTEIIASHQVHSSKPDLGIYQAAIERLGCPPSECFYTDDIPAFVDAGIALGLDSAVFRSLAQFQRDLDRRGIQWRR
jgi:glucose-1-phosphatase